jgi:O-antigen/teichoic acid export membrane protein
MDLKTKAIKSTAWYIGTRVWIQALSWGVTLVMARILAPADYGLFAMGLTVITLMEIFQEFGLGVSIVQRQNLSKEQINAIFWLLAAVSVMVVGLGFASAQFAATFYNEPRLVWIIRILSITFLINSLGVVPYSLLTRDIDFRGRSLAEAYAVAVASAVSLTMASMNYGVWALVLGHLVRVCVRNVAMFISSKWVPGLQMSFAEMRGILKFSLRITGASTLGTLTETANTAIIGRFLGGYNLGLYSVSSGLGQNNPLHKLSSGVINQLSLPVFSNLQNDPELLQKYFLKITRFLTIISLPLQVGLALVAHNAVLVLLSEKWLETVGVIQILAIGGIFHIATLPGAPLLTARGRADCVFRFSIVSTVSLISACLVGVAWGLKGVVVAWLFTFVALRIYLLMLTLGELRLSLVNYATNISSALMAAVVMIVVVLLMQKYLSANFSAFYALALDVTTGAVCYLGSLMFMDGKLNSELRAIFRELGMFSTAGQVSR